MALYSLQSEGGLTISTINSQLLAKLHLGCERADIRDVVWCLRPFANCFYNLLNTEQI